MRPDKIEFPMRVSVVIPTYNSGPYLKRAIDSVYEQTVSVHEIIVVDDGSNDHTEQVLNEFRDAPGFRLFQQSNQGPHRARNFAVRESTGDLIAFLDSDDLWYPEKLEQQLPLFENRRGCGVVYTARDWIDFEGNRIDKDFSEFRVVRKQHPVDELLVGNCVPMTTAITHRATFEEIGWFDESLPCASDWDFWLRAATTCWFDCVDKRLASHRIRPGQITSNRLAQVETFMVIREKFLKNHPGLASRPAIRKSKSVCFARRGKVRGKLGMWLPACGDLFKALCMNPLNTHAIKDLARLFSGRLA